MKMVLAMKARRIPRPKNLSFRLRALPGFVVACLAVDTHWPASRRPDLYRTNHHETMSGGLLLTIVLILAAGSAVILWGALKMMRLESYGLAVCSSIWR